MMNNILRIIRWIVWLVVPTYSISNTGRIYSRKELDTIYKLGFDDGRKGLPLRNYRDNVSKYYYERGYFNSLK